MDTFLSAAVVFVAVLLLGERTAQYAHAGNYLALAATFVGILVGVYAGQAIGKLIADGRRARAAARR